MADNTGIDWASVFLLVGAWAALVLLDRRLGAYVQSRVRRALAMRPRVSVDDLIGSPLLSTLPRPVVQRAWWVVADALGVDPEHLRPGDTLFALEALAAAETAWWMPPRSAARYATRHLSNDPVLEFDAWETARWPLEATVETPEVDWRIEWTVFLMAQVPDPRWSEPADVEEG